MCQNPLTCQTVPVYRNGQFHSFHDGATTRIDGRYDVWSVISIALAAVSLVLSLIGLSTCARIAHRQQGLSARLKHSAESPPASLKLRLDELEQAMEVLATSAKMTRVRRAALPAEGSKGEPDAYKDPDAWRKMMSKRLADAKINGSG